MTSSTLFYSSCVLFPQLLSQSSVDVPTLLAEVIRVQEVATATEVARVAVMLAVETSAREATTARDSAALHVKDVEDRATLVERESLERVSRAEAENVAVLAAAHEYAEGFARKIALLEDEFGRCLRGGTKSNSRSSPFCRPWLHAVSRHRWSPTSGASTI
jgi:hypothetical protein